MVHGENRIPYRIDRSLTGLAGPEYHAIISFGLPIEPEDSQHGEYRLNLWENQLTGEIPSELSSLSNLEGLHLHTNGLSGTIPSWLGDLAKLERLSLRNNRFSGQIPSELGNLTNLRVLYLDSNELTGYIPGQLDKLSNLEVLFLAGNELTGCIPLGLQDVRDHDLARLNLPFCDCVERGAVEDAANEGLVSDCNFLLKERDTLAGTASLNWAADLPISQWDGITIGGTPERVKELFLAKRQLTGTIPPELGWLSDNKLAVQLGIAGSQ